MKLKIIYTRSVLAALVLCTMLVSGIVLPVEGKQALSTMDYSHPVMETDQSFSAVELYQCFVSTSMTEGERLYWSNSELRIQYNAFIPDNHIRTDYNSDEGILTVIMPPYTYVAPNGAIVKWIPTRCVIDGVSYVPVEIEGIYELIVENLWHSADFNIEVFYTWQVEISSSVIEMLHNEAYETGLAASKALQEYTDKLNSYNKQLEAYEAWVSYQQWEKDYLIYCTELDVYTKKKEAYDTYTKEFDAYTKELDAYNQWQYYFDQMEAYVTYTEPYAIYQNYYKKYSDAVQKLAVMESIFVREPRGWQMYGDIMGNAVTTVLANQDMLVAGGCNANDIALAGKSTENLRVLLKAYSDLREASYSSEHQKYQALYAYYIENYEALKQNFCDLYKTLKGLYDGNPLVQSMISQKGKAEHYRQLVGHLYVVSTCLDADGYRSDNWSIAGRTLMQVIDKVHYFADGDWDPRLTAFPEIEVPKVERVERPVRPTVEQPEAEPIAPPVVENPGDGPAYVANPYDTPEPPETTHPGQAPEEVSFDSISTVLMNEVRSGVLRKYDGIIHSETLSFTTSCDHLVSINNLPVVSFYNFDGSLFHREVLNYGESISCPLPSRPNTVQYIYTPLKWGTPEGDDPDLSCVTEDLSIYPFYEATLQCYTVTWVVDGVSYSATLPYGTMPVPEDHVPISSWETPYYRCEFSGWDREVTPITGDVTYTGTTQMIPKHFTVTWCMKDKIVTEEWAYGETPVYPGELVVPHDQYTYSFISWDKPIEPVQADVTYTAKLLATPLAIGGEDTVLMAEHGETAITILATEESVNVREAAALAQREGKDLMIVWTSGFTVAMDQGALISYLSSECSRIVLQSSTENADTLYRLYFLASQGQEMSDIGFGVRVILPYQDDSTSKTHFEMQTADGWNVLENSELIVNESITLRSRIYYTIRVTISEFCNVSKVVKAALPGETVSVDIPCIYGYEITGFTLVTASGDEMFIDGHSFVMPSEAVTITLTIEKITYRISFVVDGEIWSYAEYELGESIELPADPTKPATEKYMYTFIGWGDVPATASGDQRDLVFEAQFSQSQKNIDYGTGNNNNVLLEIVLPCVGGGILLIAGGLIAWRVWRKKRLAK